MILAEKITTLRKQAGWSQEDLAEQMNVSRQSVSKWEGTNSIPDLNKIVKLAAIFNVSTDYLLKDTIENHQPLTNEFENNVMQVSLEQSLNYVETKMNNAQLIAKGVFLCILSVVPLFALLALAKTNMFTISSSIVSPVGITLLLVMISFAVSLFIKSNQFNKQLTSIEKVPFELAYGVHSIFEEKMQKYRATYHIKLSFCIALFMFSFVPLMFSHLFYNGSSVLLIMLVIMMLFIAFGVYFIILITTQYEAYNLILNEGNTNNEKSQRAKRAEKFAAFYWPLLIAIYLGWSLFTMDWGTTWIIWPISGLLFVALIGLIELLHKEES